MNVFLIVAGSVSLIAAGVHGALGQVMVMRALTPQSLPPTRLGDASETYSMLFAAWHMTSIGLGAAGAALIAGGSVVSGSTGTGMALSGAGLSSAFTLFILARIAFEEHSLLPIVKDARLLLLVAIPIVAWIGLATE